MTNRYHFYLSASMVLAILALFIVAIVLLGTGEECPAHSLFN